MNEQLNLRPLSASEQLTFNERIAKNKVHPHLFARYTNEVYVEYSRQGNFTIATVYCDNMLFTGTTKRLPTEADNEARANETAFCRALNSEPISLP